MKRPIVGTSQSTPSTTSTMWTGAARDRAQDLRGDARRAGAGISIGGRGGGHQTSLRKRRMLSASTGMTSRKRKTAIAEPMPKFAAAEGGAPHRERDHVRVRAASTRARAR